MTTFRTGTSWNGESWPNPAPVGDTTNWNYDTATGVLISKIYADGYGPSYAYTADGRLATRTWAWNNRDPIDEQGGINIYSFVTNLPVSKSDHLGRNVYEYTMSKCEIAIFYGHHYFSGKPHGIQSVKIIPSVCSYYALLGCSTDSLKNNTPLPGFNPPADMVGWYKDKDGSKGLSGYIDDAKKAAIKASMALKRCPCNCRIVKFNVICVDKKGIWSILDPSFEENKFF